MMKAKIDRDGCIGCGMCTEICPEVFEMADDGLAGTCNRSYVINEKREWFKIGTSSVCYDSIGNRSL